MLAIVGQEIVEVMSDLELLVPEVKKARDLLASRILKILLECVYEGLRLEAAMVPPSRLKELSSRRRIAKRALLHFWVEERVDHLKNQILH